MLGCFVNSAFPHFFGGSMRLAIGTFQVGNDGRLHPNPDGEDLAHAQAIPSLFVVRDVEDGPREAEGSPEYPEEYPETAEDAAEGLPAEDVEDHAFEEEAPEVVLNAKDTETARGLLNTLTQPSKGRGRRRRA